MGEVSISTNLLVVVVGLFLLAILMLLVYILRFRRNQAVSTDGKAAEPFRRPLIGVLIIFFIIATFISTVYLSQNVEDEPVEEVSVSNTYRMELEISTQATVLSSDEARVQFNAIPKVNDIPWGNGNVVSGEPWEFDIFWTVKGEKDFAQIELDLDAQNKGGFIRTIPRGNYQIKVEMVFQGVTYLESKNFSI